MKTRFLRERMKTLNKDTRWLADQCGVSKLTIEHNYLRGSRPSKAVLMLMAKALKCEISDLMHEEEDSTKIA